MIPVVNHSIDDLAHGSTAATQQSSHCYRPSSFPHIPSHQSLSLNQHHYPYSDSDQFYCANLKEEDAVANNNYYQLHQSVYNNNINNSYSFSQDELKEISCEKLFFEALDSSSTSSSSFPVTETAEKVGRRRDETEDDVLSVVVQSADVDICKEDNWQLECFRFLKQLKRHFVDPDVWNLCCWSESTKTPCACIQKFILIKCDCVAPDSGANGDRLRHHGAKHMDPTHLSPSSVEFGLEGGVAEYRVCNVCYDHSQDTYVYVEKSGENGLMFNSTKVHYLLTIYKEATEYKHVATITSNLNSSRGPTYSRKYFEYVKYVDKQRSVLRDCGLCENAVKKLLCYSNNFLYNNRNKKKLSSYNKTAISEGLKSSLRCSTDVDSSSLFGLSKFSKKKCCKKFCFQIVSSKMDWLINLRQKCNKSNLERRECIYEMLKYPHFKFCRQFIAYICNCHVVTVLKYFKNCKNDERQHENTSSDGIDNSSQPSFLQPKTSLGNYSKEGFYSNNKVLLDSNIACDENLNSFPSSAKSIQVLSSDDKSLVDSSEKCGSSLQKFWCSANEDVERAQEKRKLPQVERNHHNIIVGDCYSSHSFSNVASPFSHTQETPSGNILEGSYTQLLANHHDFSNFLYFNNSFYGDSQPTSSPSFNQLVQTDSRITTYKRQGPQVVNAATSQGVKLEAKSAVCVESCDMAQSSSECESVFPSGRMYLDNLYPIRATFETKYVPEKQRVDSIGYPNINKHEQIARDYDDKESVSSDDVELENEGSPDVGIINNSPPPSNVDLSFYPLEKQFKQLTLANGKTVLIRNSIQITPVLTSPSINSS